MLRIHCCRHKCFPVYRMEGHIVADTLLPTQTFFRLPARAAFVPDTNFVSGTKNVSDFVQKHFVSATNVSQFAQPKKHHGQQCVRNIVSSFTRALIIGFNFFFFYYFVLLNSWVVCPSMGSLTLLRTILMAFCFFIVLLYFVSCH